MTADRSSPTISEIGEFQLIARIDKVLSGRTGGAKPAGVTEPAECPDNALILGIGDDAAVIRPVPGMDLALTCDVLVAGRHFVPHWMDARATGRRAMTVNLSDIAAMGARPAHVLVSLGLPGSMPVTEVEELYRGFLEALEGTGAAVIGGNISGSGLDWFCDITLTGWIHPGCALTRAGAGPGDAILVTGSPGRSLAGLECLRWMLGKEDPDLSDPDPIRFGSHAGIEDARRRFVETLAGFVRSRPWVAGLVDAYFAPTARLDAGGRLSSWNGEAVREGSAPPVTAMLDISDGLPGDLLHICEQSGLRAELDAALFPEDALLDHASQALDRARRDWSLLPSDDYELLFTCRVEHAGRVRRRLEAETGLAVTEIGRMLPDGGGKADPITVRGIPPGSTPPSGWDHFR